MSALQDDVFASISRQVLAQGEAGMTCASDHRVNHFGHVITSVFSSLQHWRAKATLEPSAAIAPRVAPVSMT
jgi:hypothetical protein